MVFVLFSMTTVFVYDTSCAQPVATISNLHLATITDATWSPDGYTLLVPALNVSAGIAIASLTNFVAEPYPSHVYGKYWYMVSMVSIW